MQKWSMIIRPYESLWKIDLGEIWRYRDLIQLFIRRNIVVQYKQTILGPLWYLIQPTLTVIMNVVVFGGIAKMSTDGMPQALFFCSIFANRRLISVSISGGSGWSGGITKSW